VIFQFSLNGSIKWRVRTPLPTVQQAQLSLSTNQALLRLRSQAVSKRGEICPCTAIQNLPQWGIAATDRLRAKQPCATGSETTSKPMICQNLPYHAFIYQIYIRQLPKMKNFMITQLKKQCIRVLMLFAGLGVHQISVAQSILLLCNGTNVQAQVALSINLQNKIVKWGSNSGEVSAVTEQYIAMQFNSNKDISKWEGSVDRITGFLFMIMESPAGRESLFTYNCNPVKRMF
jgi:hypothetical protein